MPTDEVVPKLTQEDIDSMAAQFSTVKGIAEKLWWGWTPRWKSGIWSKSGGGYGEKTTEKMTKEEQRWFREH